MSDADTVCTVADLAELWDCWYPLAEMEIVTACEVEPIKAYLGRGAFAKVKTNTLKIFKGSNHTRMKGDEYDVMRCAIMGENIMRLHKSVLQLAREPNVEKTKLPKRWSRKLGVEIRKRDALLNQDQTLTTHMKTWKGNDNQASLGI